MVSPFVVVAKERAEMTEPQGPEDPELRVWSARPRHTTRRAGRGDCSELVCLLAYQTIPGWT